MGKGKARTGRGPILGSRAKDRHKKAIKEKGWTSAAQLLNARPEVPNLKSKHRSYYELVENKDKKKKLEFKITSDKDAPPGFEFVPIGNPELTTACKEISREQDAMIFIVSTDKRSGPGTISHQVNRIGHHVRQAIVEQARAEIGDSDTSSHDHPFGAPEPIPETQEEINEQADKAIRDLFPRIPHTDRQMIIEHSFKKGATKNGEPLVGLAKNITLSRRVQLAVLAHIRHTHTRYDQLLKETTYANARKTVESLCLDILVKWRGDEETGRDQLDEILREVIVISDSEGEDDEDDEDDDEDDDDDESDASTESSNSVQELPPSNAAFQSRSVSKTVQPASDIQPPDEVEYRHVQNDNTPYYEAPSYNLEGLGYKRVRRGFKRYQAALVSRWDKARDRVRLQEAHPAEQFGTPLDYSAAQHDLHQQDPPYPTSTPLYNGTQLPPDRRDILIRESRPSSVPRAEAPQAIRYVDNGYHPGSSGVDYRPDQYEPSPMQMPRHASMHRPSHSSGLGPSAVPYRVRSNPVSVGMDDQRIRIPSEQAQDYLVPSVEPASPTPPPASSVPVFVRTVSPRHTSRARGNPRDESFVHAGDRHSPSWGGAGYASGKRKRAADDEANSSRMAPHQEPVRRYLVSDDRRIPPAVTYEQEPVPLIPTRVPVEDSPYYQATQVASRPQPDAVPISRRQAYEQQSAILRDNMERLRLTQDWTRHSSPGAIPRPPSPYRDYRPAVPVVEMRREVFHQYDGPVEAYSTSGPHLGKIPEPNRYVEGYHSHDSRAPADNTTAFQPMEYRPSPYPPSHSLRTDFNQAPEPRHIRMIERAVPYVPTPPLLDADIRPPFERPYAGDANARPSPRREDMWAYGRQEPEYQPPAAGASSSNTSDFSDNTHGSQGYSDIPPATIPFYGYQEHHEAPRIPTRPPQQMPQRGWPPHTTY